MTGYFAQVENGIVQQVRKVSAERIAAYPDLYPGEWIEIADMHYYPAVGYSYDAAEGFRPARPYPSWVWSGLAWNAPVPVPDDGQSYEWNEVSQMWEVTV